MIENALSRYFKRRGKMSKRRPWGCLDEPQVAAYTDHQLAGRVKDAVEAHLADCGYCTNLLAFLVRIQRAKVPETVPESLLSRARALAPPKRRFELIYGWGWQAAGVATACLLVVGLLSHRQTQQHVPPPTAHSPATAPAPLPSTVVPEVQTSQDSPSAKRSKANSQSRPKVVFPPEGFTFSRKNVEFRWDAVRGVQYYELRLLSSEGDVIWQERTEENTARLPTGVNLAVGEKYFVWIRAYLAEGKSVQSRAVAFTVAGAN